MKTPRHDIPKEEVLEAREAALLKSRVDRLHRSARALSIFNKVAFGASTVLVLSMGVAKAEPKLEILLGTAGALAATTQYSRHRKHSIRQDFDSAYINTGPINRVIFLDPVMKVLDNDIGQSPLIISREDLNIREPLARMPLFLAGIFSVTYMPMAPLAFFMGTHARELRDSHLMEAALRSRLDMMKNTEFTRQL